MYVTHNKSCTDVNAGYVSCIEDSTTHRIPRLYNLTLTDLVSGLQHGRWSLIPLRRKKTSIIHDYKIVGYTLETVSKHPYLGITIMDNLSWSGHINNTTIMVHSANGFIR